MSVEYTPKYKTIGRNVLFVRKQLREILQVSVEMTTIILLFGNDFESLRVPTHPKKSGKRKNKFSGLEKSWRKEKRKMSWKNPGNCLKSIVKLELNIFLEDLFPLKAFLPQITVLENLNFNLKKSLKSHGKMHMKK